MEKAMKLVRGGMIPHQAAKKAGIAASTMYRSPLYKAWRDGTAPCDGREPWDGDLSASVKQRTDK